MYRFSVCWAKKKKKKKKEPVQIHSGRKPSKLFPGALLRREGKKKRTGRARKEKERK